MDSEQQAAWIHDMHLFSEMIRTPGWDRHRGYMEKEEFDATNKIIRDGENVEYLRGYIQGLRFAVAHPQLVIERLKAREERETDG